MAYPVPHPANGEPSYFFPLDDGRRLSTVSDYELLELFRRGPAIYESLTTRIVRVARTLILKGRKGKLRCEVEIMHAVKEHTLVQLPEVYRVVMIDPTSRCGGYNHLMVMQFIPGRTVAEIWHTLNDERREEIVAQVACFMLYLKAMPTDPHPGCLNCNDCLCEGPWFGINGSGPFATMYDMENWLNASLDAFRLINEAARCIQPFQFNDWVVTHQNITPSNLIVGEGFRVWLVDWKLAGVYPDGMEEAAMKIRREVFPDFTDRVLEAPATDEQTCAQLVSFYQVIMTERGAQLN